jgi:glycosyltransferase involved in cell wall biosynthesis
MSLRIAHFVQRYPPALGGSEAYFARLSRYLASRGDRVTVFTTCADALESFWLAGRASFPPGIGQLDGVEVRRYPLNFRFRCRRWLLKPLSLIPHRGWQCLTMSCNPISWSLWREAGRLGGGFDVVHATALPYAFPILCARRLARRLGVPLLVTPFLHLGDPRDPRDATRRAYTAPALMALVRSADIVFAQTPSEADVLAAHGVPPARIVLQGMGVDDSCTDGDRWGVRQSWKVDPEEVIIGHLANNSVEKGTVDLLRAAAILWQRGYRFRVILAGPEMPNFQRFWRDFAWASQVVRLGRLTEEEKRDFFAGIDVFALPSQSDSFGLVLLEAWSNGVPNVAYRAGGIADVVRHGQDGLLARCGDVEGLADLLQRVVDHAGLRQCLGQAGQVRIASEFQWSDKLKLVRDVYLDCSKARAKVQATSL